MKNNLIIYKKKTKKERRKNYEKPVENNKKKKQKKIKKKIKRKFYFCVLVFPFIFVFCRVSSLSKCFGVDESSYNKWKW